MIEIIIDLLTRKALSHPAPHCSLPTTHILFILFALQLNLISLPSFLWTLPAGSLSPVRDILLLFLPAKGRRGGCWELFALACVLPQSSRKDVQVRSARCKASIPHSPSVVPGGEGAVLALYSSPHSAFTHARQFLKEPDLFSVSVSALLNTAEHLHIGYKEKDQYWSSCRCLRSST